MGYYCIARLRRGEGITFDGKNMAVELAAVGDSDRISNDTALLAALRPDSYFFLSGGGSILIGDRHLIVVRRDEGAKMNPGRWSLFTGRAEGPIEWAEPRRVVRELFEELRLFHDEHVLHAVAPRFQTTIDDVQSRAHGAGSAQLMPLHEIPLPSSSVIVRRDGVCESTTSAFWHINSRNDINLLYLFGADLDLDRLTAVDGESTGGDSRRRIAALDLHEMTMVDLSGGARARVDASALPMTEHLAALVQAIAPTAPAQKGSSSA